MGNGRFHPENAQKAPDVPPFGRCPAQRAAPRSAGEAAVPPTHQGAPSLGQFAITVANMARLSRITFSRQSGDDGENISR